MVISGAGGNVIGVSGNTATVVLSGSTGYLLLLDKGLVLWRD